MRHMNRTNYREQERKAINSYYSEDNESKSLKSQINQGDEQEEQKANIQREIDQAWAEHDVSINCGYQKNKGQIQRETEQAWAEYNALNNYDNCLDEDTVTAINKYLQSPDDDSDDGTEYEESDFSYQRDKTKASRRRANAHVKKRLLKNAKIAQRNFQKRSENDNKNHLRKRKKPQGIDLRNLAVYHTNQNYKSRVVRCNNLQKKASKFQH